MITTFLSFPAIPGVDHAVLSSGMVGLIDAALRALLAAAAVWTGLHIFRAGNVLVQKSAWGLVLAGALLMPFIAPWAAHMAWVPAEATLVLPAQAWVRHMIARPEAVKAVNDIPVPPTLSQIPSIDATSASPAREAGDPIIVPSPGLSHAGRFPAPAISNSDIVGTGTADPLPAPEKRLLLLLPEATWLLYGAVSAALLLRLLYGLCASVELWFTAEPVAITSSPFLASGLRLRSSRRVSSPVTVGSGIILPADFGEWDQEKLRIVLAHERSHVRQGDFYIQALAGFYVALFWFSPLGWWLQRKLSDLSEAISDRAGLAEAASHASYAQILLEFAAVPRLTQIGVAMAHSGRLTLRIERLLNENNFRQAFAGGRRRVFAALILVPAVLFAATALIRVEAAQSPQKPETSPAPAAGQAHPDDAPDVAPEIAPATAREPGNAVVVQVPPAPPAPAAPKALAAAPAPPAPGTSPEDAEDAIAPEPPQAPEAPDALAPPPPPAHGRNGSRHRSSHGYSYFYSGNGDSYAVVSGSDKAHMTYSGNGDGDRSPEIDKARAMTHGDFLWFSRGGKSYVVDDPQTLAQIQAMYKPMEDLGRQQEELGRQQEALGRQQEELGNQQEQASIPTPDIAKEMAELNAAVAKLQAKKGGTVTQEQLADLEGKIGELQGKLGEMQGEIGARQGELGEKQGELGEKQGKLGEQQGRLGEQQGRLAQEADAKVKSIIDQSLKDGKAKPVQ
ncbi:MAG TPA: M56 family metallopeptidase [Terracidiphilus sp.]|nr:M56 family metallopeptidase [Terracidiphilus sp.]